jgi:hypothetical protein
MARRRYSVLHSPDVGSPISRRILRRHMLRGNGSSACWRTGVRPIPVITSITQADGNRPLRLRYWLMHYDIELKARKNPLASAVIGAPDIDQRELMDSICPNGGCQPHGIPSTGRFLYHSHTGTRGGVSSRSSPIDLIGLEQRAARRFAQRQRQVCLLLDSVMTHRP